jgi:hypothetical protein
MKLKLCKKCNTMNNIEDNKEICKRCENNGIIQCFICKGIICKYELGFRACSGITIDIGEGKLADVCRDCAKKIAKELLEEI